jgi:hypothetical protein
MPHSGDPIRFKQAAQSDAAKTVALKTPFANCDTTMLPNESLLVSKSFLHKRVTYSRHLY